MAMYLETAPIIKIILPDHKIISTENPGSIENPRVIKIEAYDEPGQCGFVTWFQVWDRSGVFMRINAAHVLAVYYATK